MDSTNNKFSIPSCVWNCKNYDKCDGNESKCVGFKNKYPSYDTFAKKEMMDDPMPRRFDVPLEWMFDQRMKQKY